MSTSDWIVAWFQQRNPGTKISTELNYYNEGYLDSFGIIEFIEVIEDEFSIMFEDCDFKLSSFKTITGVCELIEIRRAIPLLKHNDL